MVFLKAEKNPFIRPTINIGYAKSKVVNRQIRETNPNRVKPGEIVIFDAEKWFGFSHKYYAIMNVEGKDIVVRRLNMP